MSDEKEVYEAQRLNNIATDVADHGARLDAHDHLISTKLNSEAFEPVKLVVYGLMSTVAISVLGIVMKLLGIKIGITNG
jgi:ABC-type amino acid transport system permease subunit